MKSKKERFIILSIVILIIIIITLIITILSIKKEENMTEVEQPEIGSTLADSYAKTENNSISISSYFDIKTCMNLYLQAVDLTNSAYYRTDENGDRYLAIEKEQVQKQIYNLLSKNFIDNNNITEDNVFNKVEVFREKVVYVPLDAKVIQDGEETKSFLIYGLLQNNNLEIVKDIYAVVNIDIDFKRFSIEPLYGEYGGIEDVKIGTLEGEIQANDNNKFNIVSSSYNDIAIEYINRYKRLAIGSPERMYNQLDKEYREKRFGSLEEFKKYVQEHKEQINKIVAAQYQRTEKDDYTQFVIIDKDGNYYIFREKGVLDYTVILDTYWIDIPEFTERYYKSNDQEKVILNINKFNLALNNKDYKYMYSILADSFKEKNFKTYAEFEKYAKENFFENNKFDYVSFGNEGGTYYTYKVKITDKENTTSDAIEKTFIMVLEEETGFKMSFNIE